MVNHRQLISNTSCAFLSHFIRIITNLIIFVLIARAVGVEDFGKFTFSFSFTIMFMYVANFGLDRLTTLETSRDRTFIDKYSGSIMAARLFFSFLALLLTWLIINAMHYPKDTRLIVYILSFSVIMQSLIMFANSIFRGIEKLKYETIVAFINNILLFMLAVAFLAFGYGLIAIAFVFLFSRFVAFFFAITIYKYRVGKIRFHFDYQLCKKISRRALPFAFWSILTVVLYNIDTVLLSYLKGDYLVGIYQPAVKIIGALVVVPLILDSSFLPVLSRLHDQKSHFEALGKQLNTILFFIGVPLMAGIFVLADKIILFVYGEKFMESAVVLQVFSLILLLRFAIKGHETMLTAIGKQKVIFYIISSATICNIVFNILLIPRFGMMGAAYTAILVNIFVVISYFYISRREQKKFLLDRSVALILLIGFLSGLLIYSLRPLNIFVLITIYAACYIFFTLLFLKKERTWILQTINCNVKVNK